MDEFIYEVQWAAEAYTGFSLYRRSSLSPCHVTLLWVSDAERRSHSITVYWCSQFQPTKAQSLHHENLVITFLQTKLSLITTWECSLLVILHSIILWNCYVFNIGKGKSRVILVAVAIFQLQFKTLPDLSFPKLILLIGNNGKRWICRHTACAFSSPH